jgi:hypothetical protein
MHYFTPLIASALGLALASPVPVTDLVVLPRVAEPTEVQTLQRRYTCDTLNHVVRAIGTSKSKVAYCVFATVTAYEVCEALARRGIGGKNQPT